MAHHWTRICCAIDFSENSREALSQAAELTARSSAQLVVFHVYGRAPLASGGEAFASDPGLDERLVQELDGELDRWGAEAERMAPGRVTMETVCGDAATEIVRFAERGGFDLVVVGTRGRSAISRLVLGSVAYDVVRRATCTVLVVRPEPFRIEPD